MYAGWPTDLELNRPISVLSHRKCGYAPLWVCWEVYWEAYSEVYWEVYWSV